MRPTDRSPDELDRVRLLMEAGRFAPAHELAVRWVAARPDDADGLRVLAWTSLGVGDAEGAAQAAARAVAADPDEPGGYVLGSLAAGAQGRAAEAVMLAREATRTAPQLWAGWTRLAAAATRHGPASAEALPAARRAVALAPDEPETHLVLGDALARRSRTAAGLLRGDRRAAEAAYAQALRLDPASAAGHTRRAALELASGNPYAAADRVADALRTDPTSAGADRELAAVTSTLVGKAFWFAGLAMPFLGLVSLLDPVMVLAAFGVPALVVLLPAQQLTWRRRPAGVRRRMLHLARTHPDLRPRSLFTVAALGAWPLLVLAELGPLPRVLFAVVWLLLPVAAAGVAGVVLVRSVRAGRA